MNVTAEVIRVLIVDDHALYRRGLLTVLDTEDGIEVVGEAADGVEAVDQAEETLPDVIVMDVSMPKRGGIDACRVIKQRVPSARILMLTSSDDEANLFEAVRAGANGYLLKDVPPEEVAAGIRGVYQGQSLLSPMMASKLLTEFALISQRDTLPAPHARARAAAAHPPRARHPQARRAGPAQPRDRRRALHLREHRAQPHPQHPRQAADALAHGGGDVCRAPAAHRSRRVTGGDQA